ncbi:hypothetical protein HMPREF1219_01703 [Corynebacterium pyruviciproducens ATCC BAA-1742]|uniref:Antitoxin SocA-like Panacea domain-containing protein n=1 Tax=Corynebacterium pyruviciproducens ATCC BAA-1742 TaxID=1125779 RepID=S2ZES3_9CORY|nr:Panacea domain-containing protein [Corynebacterium pyruviciproducens]EPD68522.1 hypothetical protein HMPREF1219_01703 [Corynebacterium pyruviciproducens ATCC BAA-1742]
MTSTEPSLMATKSAQAVHFFLHEAEHDSKSVDGSMYLKIVKLLWAADRFSLRYVGHSVTLDRYSALPHGPVASGSYNLIKACAPTNGPSTYVSHADAALWRNNFEVNGYSIHAVSGPDESLLSPADTVMLERAYSAFRSSGRFHVADDISHIYPEWSRFALQLQARRTSFPIDMEDFFLNPADAEDPYFRVEDDVLAASHYLYREQATLSKAVGMAL